MRWPLVWRSSYDALQQEAISADELAQSRCDSAQQLAEERMTTINLLLADKSERDEKIAELQAEIERYQQSQDPESNPPGRPSIARVLHIAAQRRAKEKVAATK